LAAKNCSAADSEIDSKTASLPIQKSEANCVAAIQKSAAKIVSLLIQKSAAMVESFQL
jgi:hypothetical protein